MNPERCVSCLKRDGCPILSEFLQGYSTVAIDHQPQEEITLGQIIQIGGNPIGRIDGLKVHEDGVFLMRIKRDFIDKLLEETCPGEKESQ
jgi:hypothetical protein